MRECRLIPSASLNISRRFILPSLKALIHSMVFCFLPLVEYLCSHTPPMASKTISQVSFFGAGWHKLTWSNKNKPLSLWGLLAYDTLARNDSIIVGLCTVAPAAIRFHCLHFVLHAISWTINLHSITLAAEINICHFPTCRDRTRQGPSSSKMIRAVSGAVWRRQYNYNDLI